MRWKIVIEAWPYSTGAGHEADQATAGDRKQFFYVTASEFSEAAKLAACFSQGMERSTTIWRAPIMGVFREQEASHDR